MKHKTAIVGLGGIGSWFLFFIHDLIEHEQITKNHIFYLIDDDEVTDKVIKYQYFRDHEIFELKVQALAEQFGCNQFIPINKRIENDKDLIDYDSIICCVDNHKFRKLFYKHVFKNSKYWIDMRAEGRTFYIAQTHPKNTLESMLKTIDSTFKTSTSCQRKFELEQGIIQQGNKIVALIGSQIFLNHFRKQDSPKPFLSMTI